MKRLFDKSSSNWVKYDNYEWKEANGKWYITPAPNAKASLYNPMKEYETMVLSAIDIGTKAMNKASDETLRTAIMDFVLHYGLLGLMTALPTTPDFISYEGVYLPKNHFIKEESLTTDKYISFFFPFEPINFHKKGMAAFGGIAPTYHIELLERPTIIWEFNSLLLGIQMMFSFMLTDENSTLKACKNCGKAFVAMQGDDEFCSMECGDEYDTNRS